VSDWVSEHVGDWVSEWMSVWVNEWVDQWVGEWISAWVGEWSNHWLNRHRRSFWTKEDDPVNQSKLNHQMFSYGSCLRPRSSLENPTNDNVLYNTYMKVILTFLIEFIHFRRILKRLLKNSVMSSTGDTDFRL